MAKKVILMLMASAFMLISCGKALQKGEVDGWLVQTGGNNPAEITVNGKWADDDVVGWGELSLAQTGSKLSGKIVGNVATYDIIGQVSGKNIYLVALENENVYYTMNLKVAADGSLTGNYYYPKDREQKTGYPTVFKKK